MKLCKVSLINSFISENPVNRIVPFGYETFLKSITITKFRIFLPKARHG